MGSEAWAAIIAAIISAIGTIVATRFEDISTILRRPARRIAGDWESTSYKVNTDPKEPAELSFTSKQFISITQRGSKVKAVMTQTEVANKDLTPKKFTCHGEIKGDYLVYKCEAIKPEFFLVSSAMLYIDRSGGDMYGYFIANGGGKDFNNTWVGYTECKRKGN